MFVHLQGSKVESGDFAFQRVGVADNGQDELFRLDVRPRCVQCLFSRDGPQFIAIKREVIDRQVENKDLAGPIGDLFRGLQLERHRAAEVIARSIQLILGGAITHSLVVVAFYLEHLLAQAGETR